MRRHAFGGRFGAGFTLHAARHAGTSVAISTVAPYASTLSGTDADEANARARARGPSFVEALRRGDTAALALAYRAYGRELRWFASSFTRTEDEGDDVVHDVFLRLPDRLGAFRGDCDLWTWLRIMTRCEALERNRAARRRERREARWWLTSRGVRQHVEDALDRVALERALPALPEDYRTVLLLREVGGLSHSEIGERLGISENLSCVRLGRARKRLRELL